MVKLLFLPGAGASASFWSPVAQCLQSSRPTHFFSWPGLGSEPPEPGIRGLDDLVARVLDQMSEPADLVAQSMGGLIALKACLSEPRRVRRLVLTATSGGLPLEGLGASDWRTAYRAAYPNAAGWITEVQEDLSAQLGAIEAPTLLLWGDRDKISPQAVGERLGQALPNAKLYIIKGGDHDFPQTHANEVARLVDKHLR